MLQKRWSARVQGEQRPTRCPMQSGDRVAGRVPRYHQLVSMAAVGGWQHLDQLGALCHQPADFLSVQ